MPIVPLLLVTGVGYLVWRGISQPTHRLLDTHLPHNIEDAVVVASSHETNPTKLRAFAHSLLPAYPAAASVLFARATRLQTHHEPHMSSGGFDLFRTIKTMAHDAAKIGPLAFVPGAGAAVILATGLAAAGHTKEGKKIGTDLAKNPVLNTIAKTYTSGYMQANPAYFANTLIAATADRALHGERLDRAIMDNRQAVGTWLANKAALAGQIAGVPPSTTQALTAAANVAQGKPIPQNIVQAASGVVGAAVGPGASEALERGAHYGGQLAGPAAQEALTHIQQAKELLSPQLQHSFDSGVALAAAQQLQRKGFAAAHGLLRDAHPAAQALSALQAPTDDLLRTALSQVQDRLPPNAADLAHNAAVAIVSNPALGRLPSTELAARLRIPEVIARVVLASVSHEVPGSPIVHPHRLQAALGRPAAPPPPSQQAQAWSSHYASQLQDPGY